MMAIDLETPDGVFRAGFTERGLARLDFPPVRPGRRRRSSAGASSSIPSRWVALARRAVLAVVAGRQPGAWPPVDLGAATEFQQAVWKALQAIPPGQTKSYGDLAAAVGRPRAARAVGQACGANPLPLFIPCHRALAAGGRVGGFSGGLEWKRRLLEREGVRLS